MDLLGDMGTIDQLTSAREENKILQEKCKELRALVKILTIENESLKVEIEMFREEVAIPNMNTLSLNGPTDRDNTNATTTDAFVKSGNGKYIGVKNSITIPNLHDHSNLLSCTLSKDDVFLATGGADGHVRVTQWGAALNPTTAAAVVRRYSHAMDCHAPVISTEFSPVLKNMVAAGCMDGNVHLVSYATNNLSRYTDDDDDNNRSGTTNQSVVQCYSTYTTVNSSNCHRKYVRDIAWSPTQPLLATSSADGTIHIYNVLEKDTNEIMMATSQDDSMADDHNMNDMIDQKQYNVSMIQSLHFPGPVECVTFTSDGTQLICYTRGTPYLSFFDLTQDFQQTKVNLNVIDDTATAGGFTDHISYTIMDLSLLPKDGSSNFLCCATDASRNIIMDIRMNQQKIVRNLYGHQNDSYAQPKVAWSYNGQYIYGNTQNDNTVCIWDIASAKLIEQPCNGHTNTIRDLYSSYCSDTVVTTSFDKQTKFWFGPLD